MKALLWVLFSANFILVLDFVVLMPLGPELMRAFQISANEFAWIVSSYTLGAALASLLGIWWVDRHPRRQVLLTSLGGLGFTTLACAASPDFWSLIVARFAAGAFGGLSGTLIATLIAEQVPEDHRGRATAHVSSAFPLASIFGIPLGVALAQYSSWHAPFWVLGAISFAIWIVAYQQLPQTPLRLQNRRLKDFIPLLKDSNHQRALLLTFFLLMSAFLVIPFLSPFLVRNAGLPESKIPWIYFLGGLTTLVVQRAVGRASDLLGKHRVFTVMATLSLAPMMFLPFSPGLPMTGLFVVSSLFMSLVSGRFIPAVALIGTAALPVNKGAFLSLNSVIHHSAAALAPLAASLVIVQKAPTEPIQGFVVAAAISGLLSVAGILTALRIQNRDRPD